jgi:hypothetical protein
VKEPEERIKSRSDGPSSCSSFITEGKYQGEETEAIRYKYIPTGNFEEII